MSIEIITFEKYFGGNKVEENNIELTNVAKQLLLIYGEPIYEFMSQLFSTFSASGIMVDSFTKLILFLMSAS